MYLNMKNQSKMDEAAFKKLSSAITELLEAQQSKEKTVRKNARTNFNDNYKNIFGTIEFNKTELSKLGTLKAYIEKKLEEEKKEEIRRNSSPPKRPANTHPDPTQETRSIKPSISHISATVSDVNPMVSKFMNMLLGVPVERPAIDEDRAAPQDFANQYASPDPLFNARPATSAIPTAIQPASLGRLIPNSGGGDCLLHALYGRDLERKEVVHVRSQIAEITEKDTDKTEGYCANLLAAGLSQTPFFEGRAEALMRGRHAIPRTVYAAFQRIPEMYAGEDELVQWTRVAENRSYTVVMIDADGTLAAFQDGNRERLTTENLQERIDRADVLLYKTPRHWTQIRPPGKEAIPAPELPRRKVTIKLPEPSPKELPPGTKP